jgi:KDO2-lipid IV(A) lauroyltransferase
MALGRALGRAARVMARRERRIAQINLRLCLPELAEREHARILREHFESLGCAIFETAAVWWGSERRLLSRTRLEGMEHLQAALALGHGAILLSAHFTPLEIGAFVLTRRAHAAIMYQEPKNPVIGICARAGRGRHTAHVIRSDRVRELLGCLAGNTPVWYAPDQRDNDPDGVLVPFFGHPVTTSIATARIARISDAPVLPYFCERIEGDRYVMRIDPPLADFPSKDPVQDAARFHALIESQVRRRPAQYLWTYKRFKRPGEGGDPYG